jgi:hypothetical protein
MTDEGLVAAWAFFIAVEHVPMDDAHEDIAATVVDEYGEDAILRGLALVAAAMREELRHHADQLGCTCGSDAWLEQMRLHYAAQEPEDE